MFTYRTSHALASLLIALSLAAALGGCALKPLLVNKVGDALAAGGDVYASDSDLELVGSASPFGLKLMESLLAESPRHRGLLLALARGFTQYAYAYVEDPADELEEHDVDAAYAARTRARNLYLRARDYGLRGLEAAHPGIVERLHSDPKAALASIGRTDVPFVYWTAAAWGEAISLSKDDAALVGDLPQVRAMADRALALDEAFDGGSLHVFFISLSMAESKPQLERVAEAHSHFERAVALSGDHTAAPYVSYVEAVSIPTGNRTEFDRLLSHALAIDPNAVPAQRLANELFLRRARWLEARAGELFLE